MHLLIELKTIEFWKNNFINLKCLYLHNNRISEWDGILGLVGASQLISLTMFGNSIATHLQYRHFMVNHFTNLICLDGNVVVDAEIIEGLHTCFVLLLLLLRFSIDSDHMVLFVVVFFFILFGSGIYS